MTEYYSFECIHERPKHIEFFKYNWKATGVSTIQKILCIPIWIIANILSIISFCLYYITLPFALINEIIR